MHLHVVKENEDLPSSPVFDIRCHVIISRVLLGQYFYTVRIILPFVSLETTYHSLVSRQFLK